MISIDIGKDFSPKPYGRYPADGKFSAEKFREQLLLPALREAKRSEMTVIILMDNVDPDYEYTSSFLEEVFGGVIRSGELRANDVEELVAVETEDQTIWPELQFYMREAEASSAGSSFKA